MLPVNILEPIINASQISADRFLKVAGYDKTLECTILSRDNTHPEIYYVSTTGFSSLMVYAQKNAATYAIGSTVLVNVPEGNFDNEKTIIGEVVDKNAQFKIKDPEDDFLLLQTDDWQIDYKDNLIIEDQIYPPCSGPTGGEETITAIKRTNVVLVKFTIERNLSYITKNFYQILDSNKKFIIFEITYKNLTNSSETYSKLYYWPLSYYFGNIDMPNNEQDPSNGIKKEFSILYSVPDGCYISNVSIKQSSLEVYIKNIDTGKSKITYIYPKITQISYGFLKSKIESEKLKNGLYLDYYFVSVEGDNYYVSPIIYDTIQEKYCIPCQITFKSGSETTETGATISSITTIKAWKPDILWLLRHNYYQDYTNLQLDFIKYDEIKDIEKMAYVGNSRSRLIGYSSALTKSTEIDDQMSPTSFFFRITGEHLTKKNSNLLIESKKIEVKE